MNNFLTTLSRGNYNLTNEALGFLAKQEIKIPNDSRYKPVHAALYVGATFVVASANLADILAQTIYTMGKFVPAIFISIGNRFTQKPRFEDCTLSKVFEHFTRIPKASLKLIPIATITLFAGPSFALAYSQRNENEEWRKKQIEKVEDMGDEIVRRFTETETSIQFLLGEKAILERELDGAKKFIAKIKDENEKLQKSQNPQNTNVPAQPVNLDDLNSIGAMKNEIESKSQIINALKGEKKLLESDLKKANKSIEVLKRQIEELQKPQNRQNSPVNPGPMNRGGRGGPPPPPSQRGAPPPPKVPGQKKITILNKDSSEKVQAENEQGKKKDNPTGLAFSAQDIGAGLKNLRRTTSATKTSSEKKEELTEAQKKAQQLNKTDK